MVALLVVLTLAILVALDYFVFSRRYPELSAGWPAKPGLRPRSSPAWQPGSTGVFLQPTYTWGSLGAAGDLYVGVHPMLLGLVGPPCELECRRPGEHVEKGDELVRIARAGRHLTVRSPIAARVGRVNRKAVRDARWREANGREGVWLYRLRPERLAHEVATWLTGEAAADWTRRQYDELRSYLQGAVAESHLGVTMADGGELPVGILGEMDQEVWSRLEDRFLSPADMTGPQSPERFFSPFDVMPEDQQ
jgi:glycine cleavage system H lipoate-binding protein